MKKWMVYVGAACAVVAAITIYFTLFRASDEERVKQTLVRLAKAVSVKEGDTILSRGGRIKSELKEIADDDIRVDVAELGIAVIGRPKFAESATTAGLAYQTASCDFTNVTIKIDDAVTTAKVDATAVVTANQKIDKRDVHFLLRKDGAWKITTIDVMAPSSGDAP